MVIMKPQNTPEQPITTMKILTMVLEFLGNLIIAFGLLVAGMHLGGNLALEKNIDVINTFVSQYCGGVSPFGSPYTGFVPELINKNDFVFSENNTLIALNGS